MTTTQPGADTILDIAKLARYAITDGIENGAVRWRAALEVIERTAVRITAEDARLRVVLRQSEEALEECRLIATNEGLSLSDLPPTTDRLYRSRQWERISDITAKALAAIREVLA